MENTLHTSINATFAPKIPIDVVVSGNVALSFVPPTHFVNYHNKIDNSLDFNEEEAAAAKKRDYFYIGGQFKRPNSVDIQGVARYTGRNVGQLTRILRMGLPCSRCTTGICSKKFLDLLPELVMERGATAMVEVLRTWVRLFRKQEALHFELFPAENKAYLNYLALEYERLAVELEKEVDSELEEFANES